METTGDQLATLKSTRSIALLYHGCLGLALVSKSECRIPDVWVSPQSRKSLNYITEKNFSEMFQWTYFV